MIFVTVGSQKFQFNRLLKKMDELVEKKEIKEKVFAQIGVSDYIPKNYEYKDYLTQDEFNEKIEEADLIITHAGTGVIVNSLKKGKKVIGVPRLAKYGEHVDDHQIQLLEEFEKLNLIIACKDIEQLAIDIKRLDKTKFNKFESKTDILIKDITSYIEEK